MIKTEFGIIEHIDSAKDYSSYEPQKYHCVTIDDEEYIDRWWPRLELVQTYFHSLSRPALGLARYGVTLIPPESLPAFQDIVLSDKRINSDANLAALARKIQQAIEGKKYMIHFGI